MPIFLKRHFSLLIVIASAIALAFYPVADCLDCQLPNPWGRNDIAYSHRADAFVLWFTAITFLATLFKLKRPWLVPLGLLVAHVLTMHLGGVEWWSVRNNEGPVALMIGIPIGFTLLALGFLLRLAFDKLMRNKPSHETSSISQ